MKPKLIIHIDENHPILIEGLKKLIEWLKKDNNIKNYKPDNYNI